MNSLLSILIGILCPRGPCIQGFKVFEKFEHSKILNIEFLDGIGVNIDSSATYVGRLFTKKSVERAMRQSRQFKYVFYS